MPARAVVHQGEAEFLVVGDPGVVGDLLAAGERIAIDFDAALAVGVVDQIDAVAGGEAVGVAAGAAVEAVNALAADEDVVAFAAVEVVVAVVAV